MNYGIQLFGIRDLVEKDMEEALKAVSRIGYKTVEFAGFSNKTPQECAKLLKQYGLSVSGCHISLKKVDPEHIDDTIQSLLAVGSVHPVVPSIHHQTKEELEHALAVLDFAQKRFWQEGMTLHFHNHASEFLPNRDGQIPFEELYRRTNLSFELDTYWAYAANTDPVWLMEKLFADKRLSRIHLKDGTGKPEDSAGRPLGQGNTPIAAIYAKAVELGVDIIVESETLNPSGIEEAKICFEYLKTLEK